MVNTHIVGSSDPFGVVLAIFKLSDALPIGFESADRVLAKCIFVFMVLQTFIIDDLLS
jgi:hypothetical protein